MGLIALLLLEQMYGQFNHYVISCVIVHGLLQSNSIDVRLTFFGKLLIPAVFVNLITVVLKGVIEQLQMVTAVIIAGVLE